MIAPNGKIFHMNYLVNMKYDRDITLILVNIIRSWDIGGREPAYQQGTLFTDLSSIFNPLIFIAIK